MFDSNQIPPFVIHLGPQPPYGQQQSNSGNVHWHLHFLLRGRVEGSTFEVRLQFEDVQVSDKGRKNHIKGKGIESIFPGDQSQRTVDGLLGRGHDIDVCGCVVVSEWL